MIRTEFKLGLVVLVLAYFYYRSKGSGPVMLIETKSGHVKGVQSFSRDGREYFSWRHIPYAEAPVGQLRFASPKPVKKWEGIRDGSSHGPPCAQLEIFNGKFVGDEDCLHLNIFRPQIEKGLLPVLVYIHGGAFIAGYSKDFGPEYMMDEDVILVTINYRLGLLGFLSTGDKVIRGNMGLKDQAISLSWIKQNIQAFGGDPEKITIFGESAGGSSVHLLQISDKTKGLYSKGISMSGSINYWGFRPTKLVKERAINFGKKLHCPTETSQEMADCMRNLNVQDLLSVFFHDVFEAVAFKPSGTGELLGPIVEAIDDEESFMTQVPTKILAEGKAHKIPWMTGLVADDGLVTSAAFYREKGSLEIVEKNFADKMNTFFFLSIFPEKEAQEIVEEIRKFYFSKPAQDEDSLIESYTELFTDGLFASPAHQNALIQRQFSPVFLYYYNRTGGPGFGHMMSDIGNSFSTKVEYALMLVRKLINEYVFGVEANNRGICHMDELLMLFPMFGFLKVEKNVENADYKFSKDLTKLWVDFAKDETSLKFRDIEFLPTQKEGKLNYLIVEEKPKMMSEPLEKRQKFWKSLNFLQRYSKAVEANK